MIDFGIGYGNTFEIDLLKIYSQFRFLVSVPTIIDPLLKHPLSSPLSIQTNHSAKEELKLYTSLFWKPVSLQSDKPYYLQKRYYHIQAAPKGVISPLIRKNTKLFQKMINTIVTPGDFYNVS